MAIIICQATLPEELAFARALFEEYAAWLGVDLSFQGFAAELGGLPGPYAPPQGRLLLALQDGLALGCVALRPQEEGVCEMKRLYVRPPFRGQGVARQLVDRLVHEARLTGYQRMRLDTLPGMRAAIRLYEALGFVRCPAYYATPLPDTIFMELQLGSARPNGA